MQKSKKIRLAGFVIALAIFILLVGVVMWQLGPWISNSYTTVTSSGFSRIKTHHLETISLTADGTFTGVFTNDVGATITINQNGIIVADESGNQCSTTVIEQAPIHVGDKFRITASGCGIRERGDAYTLTFLIPYNLTISNITLQNNETGTIRGPVE